MTAFSVQVYPRLGMFKIALWLGLGLLGMYSGVMVAMRFAPSGPPDPLVLLQVALPPILGLAIGAVLALTIVRAVRNARTRTLQSDGVNVHLLDRAGQVVDAAPLAHLRGREGWYHRYGGDRPRPAYAMEINIGATSLVVTANTVMVIDERLDGLPTLKPTAAVTDEGYASLRSVITPARAGLNRYIHQAIASLGRGDMTPMV